MASAAAGAGAAFLFRQSTDPSEATAQVVAVEVASSTPAPSESSGQEAATQTQPNSEVADADQAVTPTPAVRQEQEQQPAADEQAQADRSSDPEMAQAAPEQADPDEPKQEVEVEPAAQLDSEPLPIAILTPDAIRQGEAVVLTVDSAEASAVVATVEGRSWNLAESSPGLWWGLLAIPRDADTGAADVVVDLYGAGGSWLLALTSSLIVIANPAPLEEIILGGTGVAPDPAAVERDIAVRFVEHTAVSGPARWDAPWMLPVEGEVTGVFGALRSYDGVQSEGWHHGHDIAAQHGDPIVAPAPGVVVWTGELVLHGIGVILDHGAGVYSGYWHMSSIAVGEGDEVAPGDWLGNIGSTGLSTGPHLHWEVIVQGIDVDPVQWTREDRPLLPPTAPAATQSAGTLD